MHGTEDRSTATPPVSVPVRRWTARRIIAVGATAATIAFLISAIQYIPVTLIGLVLAPTLFRRGAMTSERMRMRGESKLGA